MRQLQAAPWPWICTQFLRWAPLKRCRKPEQRIERCLRALIQHLFETGFNYSSEHYELSSWFTETINAKVDKRVADIESWQRATKKDPSFATSVPWLETDKSLRAILDRIEKAQGRRTPLESASDLSRIVFNHAS